MKKNNKKKNKLKYQWICISLNIDVPNDDDNNIISVTIKSHGILEKQLNAPKGDDWTKYYIVNFESFFDFQDFFASRTIKILDQYFLTMGNFYNLIEYNEFFIENDENLQTLELTE